jgi:hypothetical protein
MKLASALLLGFVALSACQETDKSYDAIHGPENVLGAPLFSAENRQQDATNRKLMEFAEKEGLFYPKEKKEEASDTAANLPADTAALPPAPPAPDAVPAAPAAASAPGHAPAGPPAPPAPAHKATH